MQRFVLDVHGARIDEIDADGIIVATPTGSTAYAMSVGGPIIDPWVNAYAIVPMAPLRLSARAIVVPGNAETVIQTITRRKSLIVLDGYYGPNITDKDKVMITSSKDKAYLITFKKDFFQKVRRKLCVMQAKAYVEDKLVSEGQFTAVIAEKGKTEYV
jgi:NAD+ kinase